MKIIVLGAGIAGTAAAWYLSEAGHDVTVIDRADAVAAETSAGNAGQLSFGLHHAVGGTGHSVKSFEMDVSGKFAADHPPRRFMGATAMADADAGQLYRSGLCA